MGQSSSISDSEHIQPFHRLHAQLSDLIFNTPPGERLPAEPELARQLGVSRATLREAMRSFEGQGLIRRRQGVGTFVVGHPRIIEAGLEVLESIEKMARKINLDVSMGALQITQMAASPVYAEALSVEEGSPLVKVSRVIFADNRPVAYLVDILPEDVLPPATLKEGFTGSVLDFLLRRGSPQPIYSVTEIQAIPAPSDIAHALEIQRGDVLQLFVAREYSTNNRVIAYSLSYFIPGYFKFRVVRNVTSEHPFV
ncbi:MAG: GntR family transcriptional regulator [Anaerolineae bacterium]|nr:GntR family transcriptional regulator [Anaerolineae bacterium]